jgi:hypothetical protein
MASKFFWSQRRLLAVALWRVTCLLLEEAAEVADVAEAKLVCHFVYCVPGEAQQPLGFDAGGALPRPPVVSCREWRG